MEVEEVEAAIDELETRLERLRSLYEQYFLGIEKIEPTVARKDVDRRIWLLRREQIRNTARRFKLQTIIQRYNTFQQYWQRICREIENGTYKRHLLRAEKNFGPDQALTIAARKRFRNRQNADAAAADKAQDAQNQLAADLGAALDDKNYDPLEEAKRAVDAALGRSDGGSGDRQAAPEPPQDKPKTPPAPGTPARSASARPKQDLGRLELDLDDDLLGAQQAPKPRPAAAVQARAPERVASPAAPVHPAPPAGARPSPPPRPAQLAVGAAPKPAPPAPSGARGRPPPPPRAAPAAPPRGAPPAARPRAAAAQAGMSEDQVRKLHARLVDARKKTNDHRNISVDGLKKSLEAAESKLRKRHGNRNIDFDVVIKDGKAVVKPIVR